MEWLQWHPVGQVTEHSQKSQISTQVFIPLNLCDSPFGCYHCPSNQQITMSEPALPKVTELITGHRWPSVWGYLAYRQMQVFQPGTTLPCTFGCHFLSFIFLTSSSATSTRMQRRSRRSSIGRRRCSSGRTAFHMSSLLVMSLGEWRQVC